MRLTSYVYNSYEENNQLWCKTDEGENVVVRHAWLSPHLIMDPRELPELLNDAERLKVEVRAEPDVYQFYWSTIWWLNKQYPILDEIIEKGFKSNFLPGGHYYVVCNPTGGKI